MNQKFFELNEEKRLAIINAGLEVFSKNFISNFRLSA